jgi:hypothetical protein
MLAALAEFPQISIRAIRRRDAGIVFLDAAAHFRNQLGLQRRRAAEQALGIGVLGLQIGADLRLQHAGIAQHLLPFGILQPGIVIGHSDAVGREGMRMTRRNRRGHGGCLLCHERSFRGSLIGYDYGTRAHRRLPRILDIPWI